MIKIGRNLSKFSTYSCQPKNRDELIEIIRERLYKEGSKCDLNDIDTSLIADMFYLFRNLDFNGDINRWDLSNVRSTAHMLVEANSTKTSQSGM